MKLFKRDTVLWTVRQVEGEMYPGKDDEGDTCYSNTHFVNEDEAWNSLLGEAESRKRLSEMHLVDAKKEMEMRENNLKGSKISLDKVKHQIESRRNAKSPA